MFRLFPSFVHQMQVRGSTKVEILSAAELRDGECSVCVPSTLQKLGELPVRSLRFGSLQRSLSGTEIMLSAGETRRVASSVRANP